MTDQPIDYYGQPIGSPGAATPGNAAAYAAAPYTPGAASGRQWPLAGWGVRVAASLIDVLLALIGLVPYVAGVVLLAMSAPSSASTNPDPLAEASAGNPEQALFGGILMLVGGLLMLGIQLWNRVFKMGRTGQSVGKKVMGLYLVSERTGNPMGAGRCFVRELAHYLDGIAYVGYLWPLWDAKKQTFADKILGTVVAQAPSAH